MKTIIYLIRHSESLNDLIKFNVNESLLITNEKTPLSVNGEKYAENWAKNSEFNDLSVIYSSNYVRAIETAKYFANHHSLLINIDENFNERIHGVNNWNELPKDFEQKQFFDENYKMINGESQLEVKERMLKGLLNIIRKHQGKRIAIITHATASAYLLKTWCDMKYQNKCTFNNQVFFDGKFKVLQTFKLTFNENELIDIKTIN